MTRVSFSKYEGLGNDFLVVEADDEGAFSRERVAAICDRRRGVGGDGILLVLPGSTARTRRMRVLNADGSIPEMCGNGIRCVALHVSGGRSGTFDFETDAGPRSCEVTPTETGADISVTMGTARRTGDRTLDLPGGAVRVVDVSMGNPHAIVVDESGRFVGETYGVGPNGTGHRTAMEQVGRAIEAATPGGTNVEFATPRADGAIDLVVLERGVGFTLACGTGACATAAYACMQGLAPFGDLTVHLPGGPLTIQIAHDFAIVMRGPARRTFSGTLDLRAYARR